MKLADMPFMGADYSFDHAVARAYRALDCWLHGASWSQDLTDWFGFEPLRPALPVPVRGERDTPVCWGYLDIKNASDRG